MKKILGIAIIALIALSNSFFDSPKATFSAEITTEGDKTYFAVTATVPGDFHIYSSDNSDDIGPVPTSLVIISEGIKSGDKLIEEGELHDSYDKNFQAQVKYYEGTVVFKREITLNKNTKKVEAEIEYMLCNDETCYPPEIIKLSASVAK